MAISTAVASLLERIGILKLVKTIKNCIPAMLNLLCRPRGLHCEFTGGNIEFQNIDGVTHYIPMPKLRITNDGEKAVTIDLKGLCIEGESYDYLCQANPYYQRLNPATNIELRLYSSNPVFDSVTIAWRETTNNFRIEPKATLELPFYPIKEASAFLTNPPKSARLFSPTRKISIEIRIGSKSFEYGVDRDKAARIFINHRAFRD